jgi:hypothetical protein
MVSLVNPESPVACLSTKGVLENELTNLSHVACPSTKNAPESELTNLLVG